MPDDFAFPDAAPPPIGHNSGDPDAVALTWPPQPADIHLYLNWQLRASVTRRDALLGGIDRFHEAHPQIASDETQAKVADWVAKQLKPFTRVAEQLRKDEKQPFLDGGKAIDQWFEALIGPIEKGIATVNAKSTAFLKAKAARELRERLAAEQKARAEAAEAARLAAEAVAKALPPEQADSALDAAIEAERRAAEAAKRAAAPAAELSRVRGEFGSVTSLRTTWTFEVENLFTLLGAIIAGKVPVDWIEINAPVIRKAIAGGKRTEAPGLRIFSVSEVK